MTTLSHYHNRSLNPMSLDKIMDLVQQPVSGPVGTGAQGYQGHVSRVTGVQGYMDMGAHGCRGTEDTGHTE